MAHRRLLVVGGIFVFIIGGMWLLITQPWNHPIPQTLPANQSLTYTDNVTGVSGSDLPSEVGGLVPGQLVIPGTNIGGTDALSAYLTDDQLQTVTQDLKNFLAARSGLSAVNAGILNRQVLQSNNKLLFTLVADRPQAKYSVTVNTSDLQSPDVAIEETD